MALQIKQQGENFILYTNGYIKILNCRVSFPHLAEKSIPKEGKPFYGITGMMPKGEAHEAAKDILIDQIKAALAEKNITAGHKNWFFYDADKRNAQNIEDGEDEVRPEYLGHYIFSARDTKIRPKVYNQRGQLVQDKDEVEELVYGGCYCHILLAPWAYNNTDVKKKGVSATLIGVQFVQNGEPFGAARVDDSDAWGDESSGNAGGSASNTADEDF